MPVVERLTRLLRAAVRDLVVVASVVVPGCAAVWIAFAQADFGFVYSGWSAASRYRLGLSNDLWDWDWLGWIALYGAGFGLSAGVLWRGGRDWWAIVVACWTLVSGGALVWVGQGIQFVGPDSQDCTYSGCWPLYWQGLILSTPAIVALVVVIVLGWWAGRVGVWVRRVVPALVFITLMLLLALVWQPWVLPFLQGPPPWQGAVP
ncbi:hypothetical protein D5R93_01700 [Actinomyces lilanjuaniae]|uniref:Uncharacterized protein n=2 Tax=Actinomyces lilanjuaniae TaxID=2321394 RepID=A0ABM6Z1C6_9ACTO|nr:hypothetical protein D5R93_01700 [Actinomyces lilanjuaniae]